MRNFCVVLVIGLGMLLGGGRAEADTFSFSAEPTDGAISGTPGSTVGWGYTITNDSSTQWLLLTDLNATTSFPNGVATNIFDYPVIAPDETVTVAFSAVAGTGLYELTWNADAPIGFTITGQFDMSADFCTDDTLATCSTTPDVFAPFSVSVTGVPEPGVITLLALGLACYMAFARKFF